MRRVAVICTFLLLIIGFFYFIRGENVERIYDKSIAALNEGDLPKALAIMKKLDTYYEHEYLREEIDEIRSKFHLRVCKDMLKMAEQKSYRRPAGYNVFNACDVLEQFEPKGKDWRPQAYDELAKIALSHELYFLEVKDDEELDVAKFLYSRLKQSPFVSPDFQQRAGAISAQMQLRWFYENSNWKDTVKKEIRNGKPFYWEV